MVARRVLVVTRHPAIDQRVVEREVRSLAAAGWSVEVHALGTYAGALPQNVRIYRLGDAPRTIRDRLRLLVRAARVVALTHAEVVHIHDPDFLIVGLLARARRLQCVYDVHEYFGMMAGGLMPNHPRSAHLLRLTIDFVELILARLVGNVSVVAPQMAARFERAGCRVAVTPNHVSARDFAPGLPADGPCRSSTAVSIGTLDEDRGSLLLVDVARAVRRELPHARFLVVRRFFSEQHQRQMLDKLGGDTETIHWVDPMPSPALPGLLRTGSIGLSLLLPVGQHPRTAPTKLYEYMSQGLAVVASDLPGTREVVLAAACGLLVDPYDVEGYATAIVHLMTNPGLAAEMGKLGQRAVTERLTWETNGELALLDLYDRLR